MIGDLVTGLHGMGGRVQGIQPHNPSEATELALQEVESNDETGAPFQTPRPPSAPSKRSPERKLVQFAAFLRRDVRLHLLIDLLSRWASLGSFSMSRSFSTSRSWSPRLGSLCFSNMVRISSPSS